MKRVFLIYIVFKYVLIAAGARSTLFFIPNQNIQRFSIYGEGIFGKFVRELLDIFSLGMPKHRSKEYCLHLYEEIDQVDHRFAHKLAKTFRRLSKDHEEFQEEASTYRNDFNNMPQHVATFFTAMDKVVTGQQGALFEDYIYHLRNYAIGHKLDMKQETGRVIREIVNAINQLSEADKEELDKVLKSAVRQYLSEALLRKAKIRKEKPRLKLRLIYES